jgi:hypothetical protein
MRLTDVETDAIRYCAKRVFGQACVVRLFGSRLDDRRRGGDIDLHVIAETPALATVQNEVLFAMALKDLIGEQRIDVIARAPGFPPQGIDDVALRTGEIVA